MKKEAFIGSDKSFINKNECSKGTLVRWNSNNNISHQSNAISYLKRKVTNTGFTSFSLAVPYSSEGIWLCLICSYSDTIVRKIRF